MKKNITKHFFYLVICLFSLLHVGSCNLDTSPTNMLPGDVVFGTGEKAEVAFNGAWSYLFETYFTYANPGYTAILRTSDAMGNDVAQLRGKYGYTAPYELSELTNATAYRTKSIWTMLYRTINSCNAIIESKTAIGDAKIGVVKGQALCLRALCYLNLVQFYQFSYQKDKTAKAVPIYTQPTVIGNEVGRPKSTVEDVYTLIIKDLLKADSLMQNYNRGVDKFRPNTFVANGLLARAYLNMGKYDRAALYAAKAAKGGSLMSTAQYKGGFNDISNVEWLWGHPQSPTQSVASYTFQYLDQVTSHTYYKSVRPDPNLMDLHDDGDVRKELYFWDSSPANLGVCGSAKFRLRADKTGDIVLMRTAEMLLIEAESLVETDQFEAGVNRLNDLLRARNAPEFVIGNKTKQELIDRILIERRKELWGEGFGLSDILRRQLSVVRKSYKQVTGKTEVEIIQNGVPKMVKITGDHWIFTLPDEGKTPFVPNSSFYLFAISETEVENNPNLNK